MTAVDRVKREMASAATAQGTATAEWIERMINVHGHELEGDMQVGAANRCAMHVFFCYAPVRKGTHRHAHDARKNANNGIIMPCFDLFRAECACVA